MNYKIINSYSKLKDFFFSAGKAIGFDIETRCLEPTNDNDILLMQFSVKDKIGIIPIRKLTFGGEEEIKKNYSKIFKLIQSILEDDSIIKIIHNAKFEYKWLKNTGITINNIYDTMVMEQVLAQGKSKFYSLATLVEKYCNIKLEKETRDEFINHDGINFTDKQLEYAAKDVQYLKKIYELQNSQMEKLPYILPVRNLELQLTPVLAEIEINGIKLDVEQFTKLYESNDRNRRSAETRLKNMLEEELFKRVNLETGFDIKSGIIGDFLEFCPFSPNLASPMQLQKMFNMLGLKIDSINENKLRQYLNNDSIAEEIKKIIKKHLIHAEYNKLCTTWGTKFLKHVKKDGRIHAEFNQLITGSGRTCVAKGTYIEAVRDVSKFPKGILIENIKEGDYVYCFDNENKLNIKKVLWANKTGFKKIIRIHWARQDRNGKIKGYVDVTPDHLVRLIDGNYKKAKNLLVNDRVLSLSRGITNLGYARLWATGYNEGIREHRFIYQKLKTDFEKNYFVHHKDKNKLNNKINNLRLISHSDHSKYHVKDTLLNPETRKKNIKIVKKLWKKGRYINAIKYGQEHNNFINLSRFVCVRLLAKNCGSPTKVPYDFQTFINKLKMHNIKGQDIALRYGHDKKYISRGRLLRLCNKPSNIIIKELKISYYKWKKLLQFYNINRKMRQINQFKKFPKYNHRITHIEFLNKYVEVYDIEIEDEHNFIANEICVHNSTSKPNLANIVSENEERDPGIRKCFIAEKGNDLIKADYDKQELRIIAVISGDKKLIEDLNNGIDIYAQAAEKHYKKRVSKKFNKPLRKNFKVVILQTNYGATPYGISMNMGIPLKEAEAIQNTYFNLYPRLYNWIQEEGLRVLELGYSQSRFGRRRYFDLPEMSYDEMKYIVKAPWNKLKKEQRELSSELKHIMRAGANNLCQSLAAEMMKKSLIEVHNKLNGLYSYKIINTVYDEILGECNSNITNEVAPIIKHIMESVAHELIPEISIPVEISIGKNWAMQED